MYICAMDELKPNRCYNCKFFARQDWGYSNWTVEGTDIMCLKKHFESTPESYSWEEENADHAFFKRAESCTDYKYSTNQVHMDVDCETTIEDYKEDKELYDAGKAFGLCPTKKEQ